MSIEEKEERVAKFRKSIHLMKILDIPCLYGSGTDIFANVYSVDLYDILMDEEKLRVLVSKLRNKAFW